MQRATVAVLVVIGLATLTAEAAPGRRRAVRIPSGPPLPIVAADAYAAVQGETLTVAAPGILGNDTLNGASLASYGASTGVEQTTVGDSTPTAQNGTVTVSAGGGFTYLSAAGFQGADTFKYTLKNGSAVATGTVTITVTSRPIATDDLFNTNSGTTLVQAAPGVLGNDTLNGAAMSSYGATSGAEQTQIGSATPTQQNGSIVIHGNGDFTYTPPAGFTGADRFRYVIGNTAGTSTALVTVNVLSTSPDFFVTSPGFFYNISGLSGENPVLTLVRGRTYRFQISTSTAHPFEIVNAPPGSVTNNNISSGILTFAVPATPGSYEYQCSIHAFGNMILTIDP